MASISITAKLSWADSPDSISLANGGDVLTQAGTGVITGEGEQTVGTSSEVLAVGDLSYPCYVLMKNIDETNYVDAAVDNANATNFARLLPSGGVAGPFLAQSAIYLKAHTAPCNVRFIAIKP